MQTNDTEYDANEDFKNSILEAFATIKERINNGGPGWNPHQQFPLNPNQTEILMLNKKKPIFSNKRAKLSEVTDNCKVLYVIGLKCFYPNKPDRLVKIGIVDKPENLLSRLKDHERNNPTGKRQDTYLLAALYCSGADESFIHKNAFSKFSWGDPYKEWYPLNDTIKDWVEFLISQSYVASTIDELIPGLKYVTNSSESWLPTSRKNKKSRGLFSTRTPSPDWTDFNNDQIMEGSYYTDPEYTRLVRDELWDGIELDPTSCPAANKNLKADRIFTMHDKAETQEWKAATLWFNPPWGEWEIWVPKLIKELQSGNVKEAILLFPVSSISTNYLSQVISLADAILFPAKRIKFWGPKATGANTDTLVAYFGPNRQRFKEVFELKGAIKFKPKEHIK